MKGEQRFVRPSEDDLGQFNTFNNVDEGVSGQDRAAGADEQEVEELKKQVEDLEEVLIEQWEYDAAPGNGDVPTPKTPAKPIEEEWKEHQVTHTPPKPWCRHCLVGRGTRRAHRTNAPDIEQGDDSPTKISIDYMYLNDEDGNKDQPQMVMVDHKHGRAFAYPVPTERSIGGEAE